MAPNPMNPPANFRSGLNSRYLTCWLRNRSSWYLRACTCWRCECIYWWIRTIPRQQGCCNLSASFQTYEDDWRSFLFNFASDHGLGCGEVACITNIFNYVAFLFLNELSDHFFEFLEGTLIHIGVDAKSFVEVVYELFGIVVFLEDLCSQILLFQFSLFLH